MQRRTKEKRRWLAAAGLLLSVCLCAGTVFMERKGTAVQDLREEPYRFSAGSGQPLQAADGMKGGLEACFPRKVLYLTFDDGPSGEVTERILDILKERKVRATFFVIGESVRRYPQTAKRIVEEGHTIGIHCDSHDYKVLYAGVDSYLKDFMRAYETVYSVTGVRARLFRFPGGSVNAFNKGNCREIIAEMERRGFVYFDWNASIEDAVPGAQPERFVENAVSTALGRKKVVLLAHDVTAGTAQCLGELLDAFPEYRTQRLTAETKPVQFARPWAAD